MRDPSLDSTSQIQSSPSELQSFPIFTLHRTTLVSGLLQAHLGDIFHDQRSHLSKLSEHSTSDNLMFDLACLEIRVADNLAVWTAEAKGNPLDDHCSELTLLALTTNRELL